MSKSLPTIKVSGGDYAKVAARLKEFKEDNAHSKQESAYIVTESGQVVFTVWLWKDKADLIDLMKCGVTDREVLRSSADANGTAKSGTAKDKDFEKLETIALGRALANLGYLASGEIASYEEMEDFEQYKVDKINEQIRDAVESLQTANTISELKTTFTGLGKLMAVPEIIAAKDERKAILNESN